MCVCPVLVSPQKWLILFVGFVGLCMCFGPSVPRVSAVTLIYSNAGIATAWSAAVERSSSGVQVNSANRVAGANGSTTFPFVPGVTYWAQWRNTEFGAIINGPEVEPVNNDDTIVVWWNGGGGPIEPTPDPWRYDQCLTNGTLYVQFVTPVIGGIPGIGFTLAPGDYNCFSYVDDSKELIQFFISSFASNGDDLGQVVKTITTDDPHWYQNEDYQPTNTVGDTFGIQLPKDLQTRTNNPIEFNTPSEDLAREDTMRTGFGSVQGAIVSGIDLLNGQLRSQAAQLSAIDASIDGGFVTVNGNLVSVGTKIDTSNAKLDTLNTTVGAQTTSLGDKLDDIEGGISLQTADIEEMRGHLHTLTNVQWSIRSQLITNDNHFMTLFSVITNKMPAPNMTLATEQTTQDIEEQITLLRNDVNYDLENIGADVTASRGFLFDIRADQRAFTNQVGQFKLQLLATNAYLGDGIWAAVSNLNDVKLILADEEELDPSLTNLLAEISGRVERVRTNTNPWFEYDFRTNSTLTDDIQHLLTNAVSYWFTDGAADATNGVKTSGIFTNIAGLENATGTLSEDAYYDGGPPNDDLWVVNLGGHEVNLNPLNQPHIAELAMWLRGLTAWLSAIVSMWFLAKGIQSTLNAMLGIELGTSSILHNIITWATGVWAVPVTISAYAAFFIVVLEMVAYSVPLITTYISAGAPWDILTFFSGTGGSSGTGAGAFTATSSNYILEAFKLINQFVAIDLMVVHFLWTITFNFGLCRVSIFVWAGMKAMPK